MPDRPCPEHLTQNRVVALFTDKSLTDCPLDRLIAKKRDFKQAMMQELLTGRIRLI